MKKNVIVFTAATLIMLISGCGGTKPANTQPTSSSQPSTSQPITSQPASAKPISTQPSSKQTSSAKQGDIQLSKTPVTPNPNLLRPDFFGKVTAIKDDSLSIQVSNHGGDGKGWSNGGKPIEFNGDEKNISVTDKTVIDQLFVGKGTNSEIIKLADLKAGDLVQIWCDDTDKSIAKKIDKIGLGTTKAQNP